MDDHTGVDGVLPDDRGVGVADAQVVGAGDGAGPRRDAEDPCVEAKADFVKTSTGFGFGGATVEDIALMSGAVKEAGLGVKASGGVRDYTAACVLIEAGATRIGTSSGIAIVAEARSAE